MVPVRQRRSRPSITLVTDRLVLLRSSPVLRGAASLYGSTITTSLLGFVFWFVAARLLTPAAVGAGSAAQSAAQLVATIGIVGLGTLSIAELSIDRTRARSLVAAATIVAGAVSAVGAVAVGLILSSSSAHLASAVGGITPLLSYAVLACLTAVALVLDDACIGLRRGRIQLARNTMFAAVKLALLPVLYYLWRDGGGQLVVVAWLVATALSLVIAYRLTGRELPGQSWRPDFAVLVAKRGLIYSHHLLNVAVVGPRLIAPVIVSAIVSPAANAGFYTAFLITGFVNIIPSQLSTALFAVTPGDEQLLAKEARTSLRLCLVLAVVSGGFFLVASHEILHVFRPAYTSAASAMILLGFSTLPSAIKAHYVAIARVQGRMSRAAAMASVAAAVEIGSLVVGGLVDGVTGTAAGLLIAYVVEAFVFAPTVARAVGGRLTASIDSPVIGREGE